MFQFQASKHKLGRGFQTQDNERILHFRSESSLTLFQNLLKSELHFKSYWNLNFRKSLCQSIIYLNPGHALQRWSVGGIQHLQIFKSESRSCTTEMISWRYTTVAKHIALEDHKIWWSRSKIRSSTEKWTSSVQRSSEAMDLGSKRSFRKIRSLPIALDNVSRYHIGEMYLCWFLWWQENKI